MNIEYNLFLDDLLQTPSAPVLLIFLLPSTSFDRILEISVSNNRENLV